MRPWYLPFVLVAAVLTGLVTCGQDDKQPLGPSSSGAGNGGDGGGTTSTTSLSGGSGGTGGAGGAVVGGGGGAVLHVLFVGNSYTSVNDLPGRVRDLSTSSDPAFVVSSVAVGAATLQNHVDSSGAVPAIQTGGWDAVVLQGQSVEPIMTPTAFQNGALALDVEIDLVGAATVFFETWARAPGHAVYQETWSGGNPTAMQAGLRAAYQTAAGATGGVMAPVGDAWETSLANHPAVPLHSGDGSHPTMAGSYLAACMFYLVLTGHQTIPAPAPAPSGLSESDAATLRAVAEATPW
ncbi:MAG: hypothetical protein JRI68_19145 [Deltaproteobacteria bacterium]|nr:hypothetical protein [Deltaproteobacteria bacterium]